jgi:hypothetical protein
MFVGIPWIWYFKLLANVKCSTRITFFVSMCDIVSLNLLDCTYAEIRYTGTRIPDLPFSSFGPSRDYGMGLCLEVYLWTIYPYFTTFRVTALSFYQILFPGPAAVLLCIYKKGGPEFECLWSGTIVTHMLYYYWV